MPREIHPGVLLPDFVPPDIRLARAVEACHAGDPYVTVRLERSLARGDRIVVSRSVLVDYDPDHRTAVFDSVPVTEIDISDPEQFMAAWARYVGGPLP